MFSMVERRCPTAEKAIFRIYFFMCLYPRLIKNPKYLPNKKNGGIIPECRDKRLLMVPIGCGDCIECRQQKANEWKVRLSEELRVNTGWYVTLTFSEDSLNKFKELFDDDDNKIATAAVRLFTERWRKKYKKAPRHWLITELGHEGTERVHLHGIIFTDKSKIEELANIWSYGWVRIGAYCNLRTINYIVKYVTKVDTDHLLFRGKIFASKGLGKTYFDRERNLNRYNEDKTKEYYITQNGSKMALPIYYRNKVYSEEERELLWLQKLDNKIIYVRGVAYDVSTQEGINLYLNALKTAQIDNVKNGYIGDKWKQDIYIERFTMINKNF